MKNPNEYIRPKMTQSITILDCSKMKTAYDCLGTHTGKRCDYAEANEGAFYGHRPKNALPLGQVTTNF